MDDFLKAMKSLISDIEGMQDRPQAFPEQFGPFSEYDDTSWGGVVIEWPNLAISLADVKAKLAELEQGPVIEGKMTPPMIRGDI